MRDMDHSTVTNTALPASLPYGIDVAALVPQDRAWLAPLLEAINDPSIAASPRKVGSVITHWGGMPGQQDQLEHALYLNCILPAIHTRLPWLLPLLDAACALVAVGPGVFTFMVRTRMGQHFDIPELIPFTYLLPWADEAERERMH
jgi:hypothetical protein